jgi:hypothetical protein
MGKLQDEPRKGVREDEILIKTEVGVRDDGIQKYMKPKMAQRLREK